MLNTAISPYVACACLRPVQACPSIHGGVQAGHALAAASEGVGVQHVGAFTLLLLPGAYVALDSGALAALGPWRTLRVRHAL